MQSKNKFTPAQRAVRRLSELNDFAWALNRMGYRAGLHRTHPAAEWLAECGVDLAGVLRGKIGGGSLAKPMRRTKKPRP